MRLDALKPSDFYVGLWRRLAFQPFLLERARIAEAMSDARIGHNNGWNGWSFEYGGVNFSVSRRGEDRWALNGGVMDDSNSEFDQSPRWPRTPEAMQLTVRAMRVVTDLLLEAVDARIEPYFCASFDESSKKHGVRKRRSLDRVSVHIGGEGLSDQVIALAGATVSHHRLDFVRERGPIQLVQDRIRPDRVSMVNVFLSDVFTVDPYPSTRPKGFKLGSVVEISAHEPVAEVESFSQWLSAACSATSANIPKRES